MRLFEILQRFVQSLLDHRVGVGGALLLEGFAQTQFQFAGGFFRKRDRNDLPHRRASGRERPQDPVDELGCLAGAGGCLDDERVVEVARDGVAGRVVVV